MAEPTLVSFVVKTSGDYATRAAATFDVEVTHALTYLHGSCPRCDDPMSFPMVSQVLRGKYRSTHQNPTRVVRMICTCTSDRHPGRPKGEEGCGAYWNLELVK